MSDQKICLFFSDTGGGHRSATEAIECALHELLLQMPAAERPEIFSENIVEKTHPLNRWFVELYNYLLRHHQSRMKYYYWFLHLTRPNESDFGYAMTKNLP